MLQLTVRTLALITDLLGVVLAFIINLLYFSLHVLGRITGITSDQTHFSWGLIVIFIELVGSLFALFIPRLWYMKHRKLGDEHAFALSFHD